MWSMGILTYIADSCMRITHETMPSIWERIWHLLSSILFEKFLYFVIGFFWINCCWIIGSFMRNETIGSSDTDKTFFLTILFKRSTCHIKIFLRVPISGQSFWIITNSTCSFMRGKKSRHISNQSLYILMKYLITFSRTRVM